MLKVKFKWILAILFVIFGIVFSKKINSKKEVIKIVNHPQIITVDDLQIIEEKIKNNDDFLIYIANSVCGDCQTFRKGPLLTILEKEKDIKFYLVDFYQKNKIKGQWDKIIGPKNKKDSKNVISSQTIKNFTFYFTPSIVFIKDGKAIFDWQDFGGGEKRSIRYFRDDPEKKIEGNKNAVEDVLELIKKWKQG